MSATVSKEDLLNALKGTLDNEIVGVVETHGNFDPMLANAAAQLSHSLRRRKKARLTLVSGQAEYTPPDDLIYFDFSTWASSRRALQPWENTPGPLPSVMVFNGEDDIKQLSFTPAPNSQQLYYYGTDFDYVYSAKHELVTDKSTIPTEQQHIFILMAQIEVLLLIARRNSAKPVQLRDGYSGAPRNGTPAALAAQLKDQLSNQLNEFRRLAS